MSQVKIIVEVAVYRKYIEIQSLFVSPPPSQKWEQVSSK